MYKKKVKGVIEHHDLSPPIIIPLVLSSYILLILLYTRLNDNIQFGIFIKAFPKNIAFENNLDLDFYRFV